MAQGYYGTEDSPLDGLHSERVVLTPHTSGEPDQYGMRLRTDLNSGNRIATVLVNNGSVGEAPVLPGGTITGSGVAEGPPVYVPGEGWGFIPIQEQGGAFEEYVIWHNGTRYGVHDTIIPDSEDLHARYDFSQYSSGATSGFGDLSGNGHDLSNGTITDVTESINGVQAGNFDGTGDEVWSDTFTDISHPFTVFAVARNDGTSNLEQIVQLQSPGSSSVNGFYWFDGNWRQFSGNEVTGSTDRSANLFTAVFDTTSSLFREDGTQTGSGDSGSRVMDLVGLGALVDQNARFFEGAIGEVLVYSSSKSSSQINDTESYLADKWGITV